MKNQNTQINTKHEVLFFITLAVVIAAGCIFSGFFCTVDGAFNWHAAKRMFCYLTLIVVSFGAGCFCTRHSNQ